jgi:phenylalanyl-tRNA synthetase beta chain
MAYLRTSLIPGLLKNVDFNIKHGATDFRLFELANVHDKTGDTLEGINEYKYLAGIIYGKEVKDSVHNSAVDEGLFSLKGYLTGVFEDRYRMRIDLKKDDYLGFDYGQTVIINRQNVGVMGRLSNHWPEVLDLDIEDAYAFEINLEPISKMMSAKKRFKPISAYPKISRDINLVMKESQSVGPIVDVIIKLGNNLIIHTSPMNIFIDDKTLGKGMKSVTFTMTFQHSSKTLEDKDVNPVIKEIIRVADKDFNAKLRS